MSAFSNIMRRFRQARQGSRKPAHQPLSKRPVLEQLEDRQLMAVTFHGGPLLANVGVETLFLGQAWQSNSTYFNQAATLDGYLQFLTKSSYMDTLTQLYPEHPVGRGQWLDGAIDLANLATSISNREIKNDLQLFINDGYLQSPDSNRLYVVFVAPNVVVTAGSQSSAPSGGGFLGYHDSFTGTSGAAINDAVIPYAGGSNAIDPNFIDPIDSMTVTTSHELAEAVTDPQFHGTKGWFDDTWVDPGTRQAGVLGEISDIAYAQDAYYLNLSWVAYLNNWAVQTVADRNDQPWIPDGCTLMRDAPPSSQDIPFATGQTFDSTVAGFSDPDTPGAPGIFTAQINWGDGQTSIGQVIDQGNGNYAVSGSHAYVRAGLYTIQVQLSDPDGDVTGVTSTASVLAIAQPGTLPALWDFSDPSGFIAAGHLDPQTSTQGVVFINTGASTTADAVLAVDALTGQPAFRYGDPTGSFASWTGPTDHSFVGDLNNGGVAELIQIHRVAASGDVPSNGFIRFVNLSTGIAERVISYGDFIPGTTTTYAQLMAGLVDPEDAVLVGHFTQSRLNPSSHLEALFFNRTNQNAGSTALVVLDLVSGQVTFTSLNDGNIFSGWLDPHDDVFASDTNNDGYDDLVLVNRVANPQAYETTNTGFIGMVSIHDLGGPPGPYRGFYRFFDWNFAKPGEHSVFPGYDDLNDHATGGIVLNNGVPTPVILLINSQYEVDNNGNPVGAAYAVLQPAPLVQGVPDSFQLISTIMQSQVPGGTFTAGDSWFMADLNGSGSDQIVSFRRGRDAANVSLQVFDALSGKLISQILAASPASNQTGTTSAAVLATPNPATTVALNAPATAAPNQLPGLASGSSSPQQLTGQPTANPTQRLVRSHQALDRLFAEIDWSSL